MSRFADLRSLWVVLLLLAACSGSGLDDGDQPAGLQAPTVHPGLLAPEATAAAPTTVPTPTPFPVPATAVSRDEPLFRTLTVYDEAIARDWTLAYSDPSEPQTTDEIAYQGDLSLAFEPRRAYSDVTFALREDAELVLRRDEVLSVRFWFNSGAGVVETGDLGLTILGSNDLTYHDPDEESVEPLVETESCTPFCFTRLYFLGYNRAVPANTWSPVELAIEDLRFDPLTEYITGFIIGSGEERLQTIFIDKVEITLLGGAE